MVRPRLDALVHATLLLAPLTATIGCTPEPEPATAPASEPGAAPPIAPVAPPVAAVVAPAPEPTPPPPAPPPPAVAPPARPDSGPGAVLVYEHRLALSPEGDPAWATGETRDHSSPGIAAASRAADPALVPAELRALVGAPFTLYRADGSSCTARAGALSLYGRLDREPEYSDAEGNAREPTADERKETGATIVEFADLLLADLVADTPCDGLWARRADLPAPTVFAAVPLDDADTTALRKRLLPRLTAHPTVVAMAKEYRAYLRDLARRTREQAEDAEDADPASEAPPVQPPWSQFLRDNLTVTRWDEVDGPRKLVNVVIGRDAGLCEEAFTSKYAVLFTLEGEQLQPHPEPGFIGPRSIMDVERDGHLEAVVHYGRIETRGPSSFPTFDYDPIECPC